MNRKKNSGFTLIELLAVIVILAIIALIAVPVIMNIISKANESAFKDTAYGVISAGELYFAEQLLEPNGMTSDVTITLPDTTKKLQIKGEVPTGSITITKEGKIAIAVSNGRYCIIKGIDDKDVTVTEDYESCNLPVNIEKIPLSENFEDNSWSDIAWAAQNNMVPSTWNIGDTKEFFMNGIKYHAIIIGKDHDTYADGSNKKAPLTFQTVEIVQEYRMNPTETVAGGWEGSDMYSYLNNETSGLINLLEEDIKSNIKAVLKSTNIGIIDSGGISPTTTRTSFDKLFLLSRIEVFGNELPGYLSPVYEVYALEGNQYEYYAMEGTIEMYGEAGNFNAAKITDDLDSWWLRTPTAEAKFEWHFNQFHTVNASESAMGDWEGYLGTFSELPPNASWTGISFAFCF